MTIHLSAEQTEKYRKRVLSPRELLTLDGHLSECSACRDLLVSGQSAIEFLSELQTVPRFERDHLTYEQLTAYINPTATDITKEIVLGHAEQCEPCSRALADLQQFDAEMQSELEPQASVMQRLTAIWEKAFFRRAFATAILTAAAAAATILFLLPRSNPPDTAANIPGMSRIPPETISDAGTTITVDGKGVRGLNKAIPADLQTIILGVASAPEVPSVRGLKPSAMRGGSNLLISPVSTSVESDVPQFEWRTAPDAESYVVEIHALLDKDFVVRSEKLQRTQWEPSHTLPRGQEYSWSIHILAFEDKEFAQSEQASFRVLSAPLAREISLDRAKFRNSHLVLGVVYQRAGMLDAAEAEFRELLNANPSSAVAEKLLANSEKLRASAQKH